MEKLLQQIRDNQRFENWAMFPGNSIYYTYKDKTQFCDYCRNGEIQFTVKRTYDDLNRLEHEEHIAFTTNGTDNV
jgi:hypothetical protein